MIEHCHDIASRGQVFEGHGLPEKGARGIAGQSAVEDAQNLSPNKCTRRRLGQPAADGCLRAGNVTRDALRL